MLVFSIANHSSLHVINPQTTENLGKESEPTDPKCPPHSIVAQVTSPPGRTASHASAGIDSPNPMPAGKHITFRPMRYVSPFKGGIFLCPQPDVGRAMSLLRYLCADDSPFSRLAGRPHFIFRFLKPRFLTPVFFFSITVIQSGSNQIRGGVIACSFADDVLPDPVFMSAFVNCVTYDDYFVRPECYGYRIFLGPEVSVRWFPRYSSHHFSLLKILVFLVMCNIFLL
jgi:hypothetical protein